MVGQFPKKNLVAVKPLVARKDAPVTASRLKSASYVIIAAGNQQRVRNTVAEVVHNRQCGSLQGAVCYLTRAWYYASSHSHREGNVDAPYNRNGGLTLVPMPGFETLARLVKQQIEERRDQPTPVDIVHPVFGLRVNSEPFLQLGKEHVGGHDCVVLTSGPGTYEMTGQLFLLLRYLAGRRAARIAVVTGYFPLSRSDKDEGQLEFALPPLIVDLMVAASCGKLDRIIAVDLHAQQVVMSGRTGFITEVSLVRRVVHRALSAADITTLGHAPMVVCFPDDTAAKRAEEAVGRAWKDVVGDDSPFIVHGAKRRKDSKESHLKVLYGDVDKVRGSIVLSFDDEIATGGTNINAGRVLKDEHGARAVWAVVTHGVLCGNAAERFSDPACAIDRLFITDTIPVENRPALQPLIASGKLVVVPWWEDLGKIIFFHHWDMSVREMR
ncbi:MAG: ribose-phosphate pyrophosphokinase [Candidatus Magasanikbacteria bacterium]|nr:ribose-phosphate pyrophosphokinase [Candidatus Magasanikbacteria bacterium]